MNDMPDDEVVLQANLRYLVNQWDPIGVADAVDDEYDWLLPPLWDLLRGGAGRAAVSQFLWYELQDHVGLDPERAGTDRFADRLVAWSAHW